LRFGNNAKVRFYDSKRAVDEIINLNYLSNAPDEFGRLAWDSLVNLKNWDNQLQSQPDHPDTVDIEYRFFCYRKKICRLALSK